MTGCVLISPIINYIACYRISRTSPFQNCTTNGLTGTTPDLCLKRHLDSLKRHRVMGFNYLKISESLRRRLVLFQNHGTWRTV